MMKRSLQSADLQPAGGTRSLVAGGIGLIAVTYGWIRFGYGLYLPQFTAEFSLSPRLAGLIGSGSFAAYCGSALLARGLIGRCGARLVLWLAAALAAVGALTVAAAWSAPVLGLGVLIAGSAAGAASPALVAALDATLPRRSLARAQAVVNGGTGAGVVLAGVAVLLMPSTWRTVWALAALAALATAAVVDRRATWPSAPSSSVAPGAGSAHHDVSTKASLRRPVLAAVLAGVGSAATWTFGRDLLTSTGGLAEQTTAGIWVLLGAAAVLGALSGDLVRTIGLRGAWVLTVALSAAGTAVFALAASQVLVAGLAGAVFGGAYTALTGVLIAWATTLRPHLAGATTATLFIALAAGQAAGSTLTGALTEQLGPVGSFLVSAALLLAAAGLAPSRTSPLDEAAARSMLRPG